MGVTELIAEKNLSSHSLAYVTFGRDIAQFDQLIQFLTWLSIIIWCGVLLTTLLRIVAHYIHAWHRYRHRKSRARAGITDIAKSNTEKKRHGYS